MVLVRVPKRFSLKNHSKKHQPPYVYVLVELGEENDGEVNFLCFAVGSSKCIVFPAKKIRNLGYTSPIRPTLQSRVLPPTHPPREQKRKDEEEGGGLKFRQTQRGKKVNPVSALYVRLGLNGREKLELDFPGTRPIC